MKKLRFQLLTYFIKSPLLFFRIGSYINVLHCNGHVAIYFRQLYADKGAKGPTIDPNYGDCCDFDPTEAHFVALYYQYILQQCQT